MIIVRDIFETVQGEGLDAGVPAVFVRLQGCSVRCYFCDEKPSWKHSSDEAFELSAADLLARLLATCPQLKRIVITGGEPTEQSLSGLIRFLHGHGYKISVETAASGSLSSELFDTYDIPLHITFSPKEIYSEAGKPYDERIWARCTEVKFVVANDESIDYIESVILAKTPMITPIFLTPDWYDYEVNKSRVLGLCLKHPARLRFGVQGHKYIGLK